jgi:hypothetical protein
MSMLLEQRRKQESNLREDLRRLIEAFFVIIIVCCVPSLYTGSFSVTAPSSFTSLHEAVASTLAR